MRVVGGVGIRHAEDRDGRLQHAHRIGGLRHEPERGNQLTRNLPRGRERHREGVELRRLGQLAVEEQVRDLLERRLARQLVDVVADVGEATVLAVKVAQAGLGGDDTLESADERAVFLRHELALSRVAK